MHDSLVRQKRAFITERILLTQDSVELRFVFEDGSSLSYLPGQFVQMLIPTPKEDQEWYVVTKQKVWDYVREHGPISLSTLTASLPTVHEHVEKLVTQLVEEGTLQHDGDVILTREERTQQDRVLPFMRSYSLGSSPLQPYLSTMIKEVPGGFFSKYVVGLERLQVGDEVLITGPIGHFSLPNEPIEHLLLIGAGSGITPLMGMIRHVLTAGLATKITLLYSNKTPEDIIYREELDALVAQYAQLEVIHTLTRVNEIHEWQGRVGRIDQFLLTTYLQQERSRAYICGPLAFAKSMKALLEEECGALPDHVKVEAYG